MGPDPQTQSGSVRVAWLWAGRARVGPRGLASPLQIWQINSCPRGRWVGGKHALRQHVAPSESPSSPSKNGAARSCRSPRGGSPAGPPRSLLRLGMSASVTARHEPGVSLARRSQWGLGWAGSPALRGVWETVGHMCPGGAGGVGRVRRCMHVRRRPRCVQRVCLLSGCPWGRGSGTELPREGKFITTRTDTG